MTFTPTPSEKLASIAERLTASTTLYEVDQHIGSMLRELTRYKQAYAALTAHAQQVEQELIEKNALIAELRDPANAEKLAAELRANAADNPPGP